MEISSLRNKEVRKELGEKSIHKAFIITIAVKAVFAALETILGLLLLFTGSVVQVVLALLENELIEDPNDFFGTHVHALLNPSHEAQVFGGLYLISHGIVKLFLVIGLLRNKMWAYPASLAVFALFILYQMVRWLSTHSVFLLLLTVMDIIIMWLIWHEYHHKLKAQTAAESSKTTI